MAGSEFLQETSSFSKFFLYSDNHIGHVHLQLELAVETQELANLENGFFLDSIANGPVMALEDGHDKMNIVLVAPLNLLGKQND